ncbi:hypothetical protein BGZ61DRAFT_483737 [Ilyonectria robusta]|uniref:uncharacterized protein n=1 Tax=Ilyonectria robusta TaxID=1079257 RepID=UPI001E8EA44D|nr:uncharacterized protein BGZ61DRAFT_483737 [Ilyonectria robusta]KAH8667823.1 hypothetical protein BGZ61DRAFT_483737 [Ilyonectria robusta]
MSIWLSTIDLQEHAIDRQLESFIANKYPGEVTPSAPRTSQPLFVHCKFSRCIKDEVTGSKRNLDQIDIALTFLCDFLKATPTAKAADILIITLYAAIINAIASAPSIIYSIQGQEGDIVAVIAGTIKAVGPGFTADNCRLNVIISCYKSALVVFGDLYIAGPLEKTKPVAKGSKPPKIKEIAAVRIQNPEGEVKKAKKAKEPKEPKKDEEVEEPNEAMEIKEPEEAEEPKGATMLWGILYT